jgi:hypothetical protein
MATVCIELGGEQARRLRELAAVARRSEQDLCREAVEQYLEGHGTPVAGGADSGYDALREMVGIVRDGPAGLSIEHDLRPGDPP